MALCVVIPGLQWHLLGHMQVCTSLQADNHASTPPLKFFSGRMPFLDLNDAKEDGVLGCSGISWTICKQSAPHSRQITTPHHSIFTGQMLFLPPNQQRQSTEDTLK